VDDIHLNLQASLSPTLRNRTMRGTQLNATKLQFRYEYIRSFEDYCSSSNCWDDSGHSLYVHVQYRTAGSNTDISVWKKL